MSVSRVRTKPKAYAMANTRPKPLTRESSVPTAITPVLRARLGLGGSVAAGAASVGVDVSWPPPWPAAETRRRARMAWRAHHTRRKHAAPTDSTTPTPEAAVDRTTNRLVPTVSRPSGDTSSMRIGNDPDVRACTRKRAVVLRCVRSTACTAARAPPGKRSWSLLSRTWMCTV